MPLRPFTKNYRDHSTAEGHQFEFFCDRCQKGFRTSFKASTMNMAAGLLRTAAGFLGGNFSKAAQVGDLVKNASKGKAWDDAYSAACTESEAHFKKCPKCGTWNCPVCRASDATCTTCTVAKPAAPASVAALCPHCKAPSGGGKFCTQCGKSTSTSWSCTKCAKTVANGKFCPDCGTPRA